MPTSSVPLEGRIGKVAPAGLPLVNGFGILDRPKDWAPEH
jgi:hypothetical protein